MPLPLATLEGYDDMTTRISPARRRLLAQKRLMEARRDAHVWAFSGFDPYTDGDDMAPLNGWWSATKRIAQKTANVTSNIVRPVAHVALQTGRATAMVATGNIGGAINKASDTLSYVASGGSSSGGSSAPAPAQAPGVVYYPGQVPGQSGGLPPWALPVGAGILVLLALRR